MQAGTSIPTEAEALLNRFTCGCPKFPADEKARRKTSMSARSRTGEATLHLYSPEISVGFPAVLARARMIELMELASARLMKPHLRDAQTSVSSEMKVTHIASTTVGGTLRAVAAYAGVAGRLHRFKINVFDESGLIGSAEHTRAVVDERRVLTTARRRADKSDTQTMV